MIRKIQMLLVQVVHRMGHTLEHFCHMTYLGLVGFEAHGSYKYAAIALLIVLVVNLVAGER